MLKVSLVHIVLRSSYLLYVIFSKKWNGFEESQALRRCLQIYSTRVSAEADL